MTLETVTAMALKLCQVHNSKVGQSQQQQQQFLLLGAADRGSVCNAKVARNGQRKEWKEGRGQDKQCLCKADKAWRREGVTIY